jgi:hypothetical protein
VCKWHNLGVNPLIAITIAGLSSLPGQSIGTSDLDDVARKVIADLPAELADEFAEQLRMESSWSGNFRSKLQEYLLKGQSQDAGIWPLLAPAPLYDALKHCPAQPIKRKWLRPGSTRSVKATKVFRSRFADSKPTPGWVYDYSDRGLKKVPGWDDPKRLLNNALLGCPPDQDLAQALLEMKMDDGSMTDVMVSFSHAYADRSGNAFPGVTLYDAWASGAEMEMPDVECLGIVHDLLDDWKTWKAPVRKQDSLYDAIGELFVQAQRHRGLRHALAVSYMTAGKEPLAEYGSNHMQFHALWEDCSSTPSALIERLPGQKAWRKFLEDWRDEVKESDALQARAQVRWTTLSQAEGRTRELCLRILRENELID